MNVSHRFNPIFRLVQHFRRAARIRASTAQPAARISHFKTCPPALFGRPFTGAAVPASGLASVQVGDFERIGHP
jgi:hypothetical protein